MYEYNTVKVEILNSIAVVKFNRPKALNALSTEMTKELSDLFDKLAVNDSVRGIILTGEGKAFMAGADITEMKEWGAFEGREFARLSNRAFSKIAEIGKPTVGAVNGFALGGGLEIALCCDWRIASENAVFAAPEVTLGIIPSGGGMQRLPRLIGSGRAKELIFTGKRINADEAEKIGLVNKVASYEDLMDEAMNSLGRALRNSSVALKYAKEAIDTGMSLDLNSGIKVEINSTGIVFASEDKYEGVTAFLEKRKPNFKNK